MPIMRRRRTEGAEEKLRERLQLAMKYVELIPTDRSPSEPKKRPYPLHSARSPECLKSTVDGQMRLGAFLRRASLSTFLPLYVVHSSLLATGQFTVGTKAFLAEDLNLALVSKTVSFAGENCIPAIPQSFA
jgi:hypothetical protein